jgi:hypothetical protein
MCPVKLLFMHFVKLFYPLQLLHPSLFIFTAASFKAIFFQSAFASLVLPFGHPPLFLAGGTFSAYDAGCSSSSSNDDAPFS